MAKMEENKAWGRVLIAGGTDWPALGRKQKVANIDREDLPEPQILRSVSNIAFTKIFTSNSGCHAVFLDVDQRAWLVGRNDHGQMGTKEDTTEPICLSDYKTIPSSLASAKIVYAACGRAHTILITSEGQAYASGANAYGACGHDSSGKDVWSFKKVEGLDKEKVVKASAGVNFTVLLCESGKVYACGCPERGQLGHGKTGEYIKSSKVMFEEETTPILLRGASEGKKIIDVSSGQNHSLALDNNGYVYSWGSGALGRLGHGIQKDCLVPTVIDQFTHPKRIMRCTKIACGSTNSLFLDGQKMFFLSGKFKNSGDGSSGQPWMTPKTVQDVQSYQMKILAAGGVTLFAVAEDGEKSIPIALGQNAINGELALGVGEPKSATKPIRVEPLVDLDIIDIAAGQNTTFFLVRPPAGATELKAYAAKVDPVPEASAAHQYDSGWGFNDPPPLPSPPVASSSSFNLSESSKARPSSTATEKWEELQRFPVLLESSDACVVCKRESEDEDESDPLLECEKCEDAYHLQCVKLGAVPETDWFCDGCVGGKAIAVKSDSRKRKAADQDEEGEEEEEEKDVPAAKRGGKKPSAGPRRGRGKKMK